VITSILLGTAVTISWQLAQTYGPISMREAIRDIDAIYPALIMSVSSLVLVSLLTESTIRSRPTPVAHS